VSFAAPPTRPVAHRHGGAGIRVQAVSVIIGAHLDEAFSCGIHERCFEGVRRNLHEVRRQPTDLPQTFDAVARTAS
jgi:hypothetical protein